MPLSVQLVWLFVLAIPAACIAWTVTHEELFREPREFCVARSQAARGWVPRKFFYVFTCEYCFSHYVVLALLAMTEFRLLLDGWRGYLLAWFALVWIANQYMSLYNRLRLVIKDENMEIKLKEDLLEAEP